MSVALGLRAQRILDAVLVWQARRDLEFPRLAASGDAPSVRTCASVAMRVRSGAPTLVDCSPTLDSRRPGRRERC